MAWKARIAWLRADLDGDARLVGVDFFDEAAPEQVFSDSFRFEQGTSKAQAQNQIRARGAEIRDRVAASESLLRSIVGTEITIP